MVLRNAGRLTEVATLAHPAAQAARNSALRFLLGFQAVQDKMAATMSEIEIAYPKSPLSQGQGAGRRLPPANDDGAPPGAGPAPRFVLYADDAARGTALAARYPGLLDPAPRKPPERDRLLIVRPDGYIGLAAGAAAWDEVDRYLAALTANA